MSMRLQITPFALPARLSTRLRWRVAKVDLHFAQPDLSRGKATSVYLIIKFCAVSVWTARLRL